MDTDSFVNNVFTEDFFEDINNDVERWFNTSNYNENDKRPLPTGINKKVIGLFTSLNNPMTFLGGVRGKNHERILCT